MAGYFRQGRGSRPAGSNAPPAAPPAAKPAAGQFKAIKQKVEDRGVPPDSYLNELIAWGRSAPDEIFASNSASFDVLGKAERGFPVRTVGWAAGKHRMDIAPEGGHAQILRVPLGVLNPRGNGRKAWTRRTRPAWRTPWDRKPASFRSATIRSGWKRADSTLRACVKQYCDGSTSWRSLFRT